MSKVHKTISLEQVFFDYLQEEIIDKGVAKVMMGHRRRWRFSDED